LDSKKNLKMPFDGESEGNPSPSINAWIILTPKGRVVKKMLDLVARRYFCIGDVQHVEVTEHISP
jgi:hypothetical protein